MLKMEGSSIWRKELDELKHLKNNYKLELKSNEPRFEILPNIDTYPQHRYCLCDQDEKATKWIWYKNLQPTADFLSKEHYSWYWCWDFKPWGKNKEIITAHHFFNEHWKTIP